MDLEESPIRRSEEMMRSFWGVQRYLVRLMHQTALANELTLPQLHGLMMVVRYGAISQKELVRHMNVPKSTLSQAIDGLVTNGWVERDVNEANRRETILTSSEAGRRFVRDIEYQQASAHQQVERVLQTLDVATFDQLIETHRQIADGLKQQMTRDEGGCFHGEVTQTTERL